MYVKFHSPTSKLNSGVICDSEPENLCDGGVICDSGVRRRQKETRVRQCRSQLATRNRKKKSEATEIPKFRDLSLDHVPVKKNNHVLTFNLEKL
jgi:hypothetical protein